jgi:hypothetical protein
MGGDDKTYNDVKKLIEDCLDPKKLKEMTEKRKQRRRRSPKRRMTSDIVKGFFKARSIVDEIEDTSSIMRVNYRDVTKDENVSKFIHEFIDSYLVPFEEKNTALRGLSGTNYF